MGIFRRRPVQGPKNITRPKEPLNERIGRGLRNQYDKSKDRYNERMQERKNQRDIYNTAYNRARSKGLEKKAEMKAYQDLGIRRTTHTRPVRKTKKGKRRTRRTYTTYDFTNNYNPIGTTWDSGVPSSKKRKRQTYDPIDNWGFL